MRTWVLQNLDSGEQHKFYQMIDVEAFLNKSRTYIRNSVKNGFNVHDGKGNRFDIFVITKNRMPIKPGYHEQLCCSCKNFAYGCEWSERFEPVPGWKATQTLLDSGSERYVKSYCITECPKFVKG